MGFQKFGIQFFRSIGTIGFSGSSLIPLYKNEILFPSIKDRIGKGRKRASRASVQKQDNGFGSIGGFNADIVFYSSNRKKFRTVYRLLPKTVKLET